MSAIHCFFCGGQNCKYENYQLWTQESNYAGQNAFDGLYSSWITNDILATQRPSTRLNQEYSLIKQFRDADITAIFNLQMFGEHASCGDGINTQGFSYSPLEYMSKNIAYYNFGWPDMTTPRIPLMLNIVTAMAHHLDNGGKIAIHCHAGLGRTGLAIACYLVLNRNLSPGNAILAVRAKRPGSVQTQSQTLFVTQFGQFCEQLKVVYPGLYYKTQTHAIPMEKISLREYVQNQNMILKERDLKHLGLIPQVLNLIGCCCYFRKD